MQRPLELKLRCAGAPLCFCDLSRRACGRGPSPASARGRVEGIPGLSTADAAAALGPVHGRLLSAGRGRARFLRARAAGGARVWCMAGSGHAVPGSGLACGELHSSAVLRRGRRSHRAAGHIGALTRAGAKPRRTARDLAHLASGGPAAKVLPGYMSCCRAFGRTGPTRRARPPSAATSGWSCCAGLPRTRSRTCWTGWSWCSRCCSPNHSAGSVSSSLTTWSRRTGGSASGSVARLPRSHNRSPTCCGRSPTDGRT